MPRVQCEHYVLVQSDGVTFVETECVGSCQRKYRVDEHHPEYANVKAALERGDRSVVFCYHKRDCA